jgi:hypothetical protein
VKQSKELVVQQRDGTRGEMEAENWKPNGVGELSRNKVTDMQRKGGGKE